MFHDIPFYFNTPFYLVLMRSKCCVSCSVISDSATPWTVAPQAPLSMGFSRPEYWSGLPFPSPGDLPDPGTEPMSPLSPALQADSLPTKPLGKPKGGGYIRNEKMIKLKILIAVINV